jgi:hypothetical protein
VPGTYTQLVEVFGQPDPEPCDPDKTHAEWTAMTPHGVATLYDYGSIHRCRSRCRRDPRKLPERLVSWHVGGHNAESAEWVAARLGVKLEAF